MSNDQQIDKLLEMIEVQRKEINTLDNPVWKTSKSFSFNEENSNMNVNIATYPTDKLVKIITWCYQQVNTTKEVLRDLDLDIKVLHQGFSYEDWIHDCKLAINRKQISEKKAKLDKLEAKLNELVSPELRRQKELERIAKELGI